jgi:hypothetical protein
MPTQVKSGLAISFALQLTTVLLVSGNLGAAATFKWTGLRYPSKVSAGDGITDLNVKIGKFEVLSADHAAQAIFNVNNRFQGSTPWTTLAIGPVPDAPAVSLKMHETLLARMDALNVDVFLEIYPRKTNNVLSEIDRGLAQFGRHRSVKGFGVDLEYYRRVDDATAQAWDEKLKAHNPDYRLFLKHWEASFMPPTYRGQGDLIFINTSSEASVESLNTEFAEWAAHFAPAACAFQIGYPADEDAMNGSRTGGWWRLQDPIKNWGNALLARIPSPDQSLGLLWVGVKSGKSYNANWDLTHGATLAVPAADNTNVISASPPALRSSDALRRLTTLFDGTSLDGWEFDSNAWKLVEGAMRGSGKGGNIFTKADYGDFRLIVTARVASPEGNPGRDHLGVLFWGERATNFSTAKALQVQPTHGAMWDYRTNQGIKPEHPTPWPRPRYQDWHICEILARLATGEVRAAVDGIAVMKYRHPNPAVLQRGPIGMQIHGSVGVFDHKDIRVEVDPKEDRLITLKE